MFSAEDMTRLTDLVRDKSRSKKRDREEKTKTPAGEPQKQPLETPTPAEAKKPAAPKEKGVVFKEPVPQANPSLRSFLETKAKVKW